MKFSSVASLLTLALGISAHRNANTRQTSVLVEDNGVSSNNTDLSEPGWLDQKYGNATDLEKFENDDASLNKPDLSVPELIMQKHWNGTDLEDFHIEEYPELLDERVDVADEVAGNGWNDTSAANTTQNPFAGKKLGKRHSWTHVRLMAYENEYRMIIRDLYHRKEAALKELFVDGGPTTEQEVNAAYDLDVNQKIRAEIVAFVTSRCRTFWRAFQMRAYTRNELNACIKYTMRFYDRGKKDIGIERGLGDRFGEKDPDSAIGAE